MKKSYLFVLIICIAACKYTGENQENILAGKCKVISLSGFEEKAGSLSRVYEQIAYVPLETTSKALLSDIQKILIHNDTIIVKVENSNSNSHVFSFDIKGNFINSVGKIGKGPGEYINPMDILVDSRSSTVEILDAALLKIIKYDFTGNLLNETKIDFLGSPFNFIKNDRDSYFYYMSNNTVDDKNVHNLYLVDGKGKIEDKFLPIPESFQNLRLISPNNLQNTPSGKFAIPSPSFTVYELSDKNVRERFCFDFGELSMPMEGLKLETDKKKLDFLSNNKFITRIDNFFISNNTIFFTVFYDKKFIYFWYDLDKDFYITYKYDSDPGIDDVLIKYSYPFTVYRNSFVSWQHSYELNLESLNNQLGLNDENRKITNNSNPVLIFSKLRNNFEN